MQVSVIIPTYNRKYFVQEAIDSVLAQTYSGYEIIVVDDGSTDGSGDLLQARYGDCIRYIWQENQGESVARNVGIEMAQGDYIAFLDSDDLWLPQKLDRQVAYLEIFTGMGAVICQSLVIDREGNPWPGNPVLGENIRAEDLTLDALLFVNTVGSPSTMLVRRDVLDAVGGFDPSIRYGEDWDLCVRLRVRAPIGHLEQPLCRIRYHQSNQWRLRTWEIIEPTLRDRLRIIDKVFSLVSKTDNKYQVLRRRAEAREYTDAGLAALAWGKYQRGSVLLTHTADAIRENWTDPARVGNQFSQLLFEVQERNRYYGARELQVILSHVLTALSDAKFDRRSRKTFTQSTLANLFFEAANRRDYAAIRWVMPRLLHISPRWARNLGVWSIGLDAYLGENVSSRLRILASRQLRSSRHKGQAKG